MNKKNIIIFLGGLLTGGIGGVFGTKLYFKSKYEKISNDEIEKVREYYFAREQYVEKARRENENVEEKEESREDGVLSPEARAEIKEKLRKNREWAEKQTINYTAMYEERHGVDPADLESPLEDDPISEEEKAFERHQEDKDKEPEIISIEEASNLPAGVESQSLFFYTYDETLTDEDDEVIDDPELILGNDIWGLLCDTTYLEERIKEDEDGNMMCVMNFAHDTCYEIQIVDDSFEASHYGEDE